MASKQKSRTQVNLMVANDDKHSFLVHDDNILQEYAAQKPNVLAIQQEEFRLFSNQGLVLIKKVDGTMSILKANGDMFHFEKLNGGIEEKSK
ncbi:hypothetical protein HUJ05_007721, partial [Dendroctonus ponderosae]